MMRTLCSAFLILLALALPAAASSTIVGGKRMSCGAVRVVHSNTLQDAGYAKPGLIILNPNWLARMPWETQRLIFLHECAHQHVGFVNSETEADCWAIRRGKQEGWLNRRAMDRICQTVSTWVGSSVHLPGPARCQAMRRCFAGN